MCVCEEEVVVVYWTKSSVSVELLAKVELSVDVEAEDDSIGCELYINSSDVWMFATEQFRGTFERSV